MELVQAHQLLAQPDIPVELGKIFVHRLDQVVVHRHRDVGAVQGGLQGAAVLPGVGTELQLLVLGVEQRRLGVAKPAQGIVHALIGAAAKLTVIALLQGDEACMVYGVADTLPIQSIREGHIRIEQRRVGVLGSLGHLCGGRQELFLLGGQCVGLSAAQIRKIAAVALQPGADGIKALQGIVLNGHDLRGVKAGGGAYLHHPVHKPAGHGLALRVPGVLVRLAHTVVSKVGGLDLQFFQLIQVAAQILPAEAQLSLEGCQGFGILMEGFQLPLPILCPGVKVFQRPAILLGDLLPTAKLFHMHSSVCNVCLYCTTFPVKSNTPCILPESVVKYASARRKHFPGASLRIRKVSP